MASYILGGLVGFSGAPVSLTPEAVEGSFGEALEARIVLAVPRALAHLTRKPGTDCARAWGAPAQVRDETVARLFKEGGLGSPDLCWLRKARAAACLLPANPHGLFRSRLARGGRRSARTHRGERA